MFTFRTGSYLGPVLILEKTLNFSGLPQVHTRKQSQLEIHLDVKNTQMHILKNGKNIILKNCNTTQ